jgi:hypothetical protein
VFVANPLAKMLMYADHQRSITYVEMLRWARKFGVDLPDFFDEANQELYDRAGEFAPIPQRSRPLVFLFEVVAQAYAEGWIGLDRVLLWAEERQLEDDEVMTLLDRCASEGHAYKLEPV